MQSKWLVAVLLVLSYLLVEQTGTFPGSVALAQGNIRYAIWAARKIDLKGNASISAINSVTRGRVIGYNFICSPGLYNT